MLFDTRGRHRRRAVRVIYIGLACIFLLGFVGLGVGGGFGSGGIFSAFTNAEGGSSASFSAQIKKYQKLTKKEPNNASAWENLTKNLLHESGGSETYVTSTGQATAKGKELFKEASHAWESYVALDSAKPNAELAQLMEGVYGEGGLNEPAKQVEVLQIAVAARPTDAALYAALAEAAYKAHNTRVGDLASEKAVSLSPATDRTRVKDELAEVKANPSGEKTYTTTTNGKTYAGKLNAKKELEATEVKTKTAPAGTTTTSKSK
ncbi:MAG: hypothetical protein ABSG93_00620 [Solirubrobacteraceae bacterium]|jgi:hypothetical protein